ncbi:MAG: sigma-54-dependent transcriptional regulator [bacterium]
MKPSILIIEDDQLMCRALESFCRKNAFAAHSASSASDGLALFQKHTVDVVLLDMRLPDANGMDVLTRIRKLDDEVAVIMMTAFPDVKSAVETIKGGAFDYVIKPFEVEELRQIVNKALELRSLRTEVLRLQRERADDRFPEILGTSPAILKIKELIAKVGQSAGTSVLIIGASGTGKELAANAVHFASERRDKPLVKINCSALPDHLLESELFGYEKGAFTGAIARKPGLFELAAGGMLFLDEISEMQLPMQPKLLRVLEGHPFRRLGGTKDIQVDVRIIAASNRNLDKLARNGYFREDLYYRLSTFIIELPPLCRRREDILLLASHFLSTCAADMRKKIAGFAENAKEVLLQYDWPGNIRELHNVIERAVILCDADAISREHLPGQLIPVAPAPSGAAYSDTNWKLAEVERQHILWVLDQVDGNKAEAVRRLGIARSTFDEKLKKYKHLSEFDNENVYPMG